MLTKHLGTKLSILLTTTLFLLSCNKNDEGLNPIPPPAAKKVWKIKINQTDSTLFAYTTTGQLHKIISTDYGSTFTFLYDASDRITEISSSAGVRHKFVYENNRLRLTEHFQDLYKVSENVFDYSADKIITSTLSTRFDSTNGMSIYRPTFKVSFRYNNSGDVTNVITYRQRENDQHFYKFSEKVIEQFDNAKNPLSVLKYLTLLTIYEMEGNKNILKEKMYDALGNVKKTTVTTFQYDEAKNPVSSISTVAPTGETPFTISCTYYYK